MTKVKRISIEKLHNEEDLIFHKRIKEETIHLTLETVPGMVATYKEALLDYDRALKYDTRNSHTAEIVHIDSLTDIAWRGLHTLLKVTLKHPNESYRPMAILYYNLMNKYGDVTRWGYNEKYGNVLNFLQNIKSLNEEKQKQISIYDWVVELQTRYDEFLVVSTARNEEDSRRIVGIVKEMRHNVDYAYRELMEHVNALSLINGWAEYASFIINVNVIIDEMRAVLAARKISAK